MLRVTCQRLLCLRPRFANDGCQVERPRDSWIKATCAAGSGVLAMTWAMVATPSLSLVELLREVGMGTNNTLLTVAPEQLPPGLELPADSM